MKMYRVDEVRIYALLIMALDKGKVNLCFHSFTSGRSVQVTHLVSQWCQSAHSYEHNLIPAGI